MSKFLFTSESVTEGHPDKVCDRVSDAVLDAMLEGDKMSRVACETFASTGVITVMGEITTSASVDIEKIIREVVCEIGYKSEDDFFDGNTCKVNVALDKQSADIALGVDRSLEMKDGDEDELNQFGAGDQGMMFGYACDETPELMPMTTALAHKMAKRLTDVRKQGILPYLKPDGKTQITIEYDNDRPVRLDTVVVSSQHSKDVSLEKLREDILTHVILPVIPEQFKNDKFRVLINPTGRFVVGGPAGDTGLTGRKIIVDTYGGVARHGGGAFSGKDPTKVDRSAAYAARYVAKNVVAAGLARKCEIQLAYAIGVANPVSVMVDTFGTGKYPDEKIAEAVKSVFDLRPAAIIRDLNLRETKYRELSAYGHMGRVDINISWEKTDRTDALIKAIEN